MTDAIGMAARGIADGFTRLDRTSARIAADAEDATVADSMVDLRRARQQVRANVTALRVADETIGSLLDVLA